MNKFRILVILFAVAVFFQSCLNESGVEKPSEVTFEYIDPNDDFKLLESLENMNTENRSGRIQSHDFGNIDLSEAIKINNPHKNLTRYSLLLEPESTGYYENLIIRYQEDTVISYITRTYPDLDWLIENKGDLLQKGFTGKKQLLTLDRVLIAEALFENGFGSQVGAVKIKNGRSECEGDNDGGGSGGGTGGGGTGGGGTGGGGTGGGGTGGGGTGGGGTGGGGSGGGEACDWHQSETTGWLVIECPGMDAIYIKQRTECDGPIDMPEGDCIDDDCPEDPIGDLPPDDSDLIMLWSLNTTLFEDISGEPITNIDEYLECFDPNSNGEVTIFVDQPSPGERDTWSGSAFSPNVGHTFIGIQQGLINRTLGFYPNDGVNPYTDPSAASVLIDDSGHSYDVSITLNLSASSMSILLDYIKSYSSDYDLNDFNCTDFAIESLGTTGTDLPDTNGTWPGGGGSNPGDLGEDIRELNSSANQTIEETGGFAPSNTGSCN